MTLNALRCTILALLFALTSNTVDASSGGGIPPGRKNNNRQDNNQPANGSPLDAPANDAGAGNRPPQIPTDTNNASPAGNPNADTRPAPPVGGIRLFPPGVVPGLQNLKPIPKLVDRANPIVQPPVAPRKPPEPLEKANQLGTPPPVVPRIRPKLGDANQATPANTGAPQGNLGQNSPDPNQNNNNVADVDNRQTNNNPASSSTPPNRPPPLPPRWGNDPNVYRPPVATNFDPSKLPPTVFNGRLNNDPVTQIYYLDEDGQLSKKTNGIDGWSPIGKFLGGGANSRVHTSSDPSKVKKIVSLSGEFAIPSIVDQNFGRTLLNDLKERTKSQYFSVAQQHQQFIITAYDDEKKPMNI